MLYLRGEVFIRAALVKVRLAEKLNPILTHPPRDLSVFHFSQQFTTIDWLSQGFQTHFSILTQVKGTVIGYLTPEVGIIEVRDSNGETKKVIL